MNNDSNAKLDLLLKQIELPDHAYEAAKRRYDDLGAWVDRDGCTLKSFDPHIFVQGSFALGTAIRPVKAGQEYDLDLSCKLRRGIDRTTHSQRQVKDMVGRELEAYRVYRKIQDRLEPKHRCWRLKYQDDLPFHLDVVPGIFADPTRRSQLALMLEQRGADRRLAEDIAADSMWITDDRSPYFESIHLDWLSSNPEGYVRWFLSRMEGTRRALKMEAQVDDVPVYRRKSTLQRAIQLLKGHRDAMFEHACEHRPISVIVTTLAGEVYVPGQSLAETMGTLLRAFDKFRRSNSDVVLNPVNPQENFADRWKTVEGRRHELKENFHRWIVQVTADFQYVLEQTDPRELIKRAQSAWRVRLDERAVTAALGATVPAPASPRRVSIQSAPKPWACKS
jgi:cyclic GMP-AMP synthase DncV-like protein